ncbi:hypothetical protein, partial [Microcoleus sp. B9-D4]|uniref:hypothetical protein n=1 Tax=Microcoleus sp. B9-D4 TaxID=2818711 RepID=UPI002FD11F17
PRIWMKACEALPLDMGSQAEPRNQLTCETNIETVSAIQRFTRYQALPGNTYHEALPRIWMKACEALPLDMGSQAEPRNQLNKHRNSVGNSTLC